VAVLRLEDWVELGGDESRLVNRSTDTEGLTIARSTAWSIELNQLTAGLKDIVGHKMFVGMGDFAVVTYTHFLELQKAYIEENYGGGDDD